MNEKLHKAQLSILHTMRLTPVSRFTDLRQPTGLESDTFKFHLRKLGHLGYIRKRTSGEYELTASGKELANSLDRTQRAIRKQPKLSVMIIAGRVTENGKEYVFQQRLRSPYHGYWGCISGPVQWGESLEAAARREFTKQTGLTGEYTVRSFYRLTDYSTESGNLLEDKLFAIVEAHDLTGELSNSWSNGLNKWLTIAEFQQQEKYYTSTQDCIDMVEQHQAYGARTITYPDAHY